MRTISNAILVNATLQEIRAALVEDGMVAEFYLERHRDRGIAGNIYKGKVIRVLPGMQAAFVEVGLERAAFLYVADVYSNFREMFPNLEDHEELDMDRIEARDRSRHFTGDTQIENLIREGQDILVQVAREPIGTKGSQITTHISLPGRYLVYMPTMHHVGVSRRIENEKKRAQLRHLVEELRPEGAGGFIVRTASEDSTEKELNADMVYLLKLWSDIKERTRRASTPSIVHQDLTLDLKVVRDLLTDRVEKIIVDSRDHYEEILNFIDTFLPRRRDAVELWEEGEPLFEHFGMEMEISRALDRKVWLKSGGYIVIDQTEALTAIDVNTGRYVGKRNFEDTVLKTNLEAVKEIVYQLRLRNIGGIIIIDFIDMNQEQNRDRVVQTLIAALKRDKARSSILKISELGLVEMTRKRTRENLNQLLCEPCPYCEGKGYLKSRETVASEIFREVRQNGTALKGRQINVHVHPEVAELLFEEEQEGIARLEKDMGIKVQIMANNNFHQEQFEITPV
jgi:ribonuclease G